jgi:hypothetical protein
MIKKYYELEKFKLFIEEFEFSINNISKLQILKFIDRNRILNLKIKYLKELL